LRFEVQCLYGRTNWIKSKNSLPDKEILGFIGITDEVKNILTKAYRETCGIGDYYTYDEAKKMVLNSNRQARTKKSLLKALELINGNNGVKSVYKAQAKYEQETDETYMEYSKVIKTLNDLGINPVTIPRSWNIKHLKSLYPEVLLKCESLEDSE